MLDAFPIPIGSMYGIFTYIYHKNQPNVGKSDAIHGSYVIQCTETGPRKIHQRRSQHGKISPTHWFVQSGALDLVRGTPPKFHIFHGNLRYPPKATPPKK